MSGSWMCCGESVLQLGGNRSDHAERRPARIEVADVCRPRPCSPGEPVAARGWTGERCDQRTARLRGSTRSPCTKLRAVVVIGFAIEAAARELVEKCGDLVGIPATYVQATPDLVMGDLLKTMRSSQIFSVTGLPDVAITEGSARGEGRSSAVPGRAAWPRRLRSDDDEGRPPRGRDVPAWFLDTDYNEMCFLVSQAFFPRTSAWESLESAHRTASSRTPCGNTWPGRQARHSWRATDGRWRSK